MNQNNNRTNRQTEKQASKQEIDKKAKNANKQIDTDEQINESQDNDETNK